MDEPTSALDPISTTKIEDLMQELKKDYSIIIVTHNMQQAARISDRTAFFYRYRRHHRLDEGIYTRMRIQQQAVELLQVPVGR